MDETPPEAPAVRKMDSGSAGYPSRSRIERQRDPGRRENELAITSMRRPGYGDAVPSRNSQSPTAASVLMGTSFHRWSDVG